MEEIVETARIQKLQSRSRRDTQDPSEKPSSINTLIPLETLQPHMA